MSKKQKRMLFRVLASAVLFAVALLLPTEGWLRLFTFLIPYAVIAWDVLWRAVRNIAHGQVFDENFLMALATVGALATGEYPEAVFVMLFDIVQQSCPTQPKIIRLFADIVQHFQRMVKVILVRPSVSCFYSLQGSQFRKN